MRKAFFWLVQNIAEYRSPLVSISLPVKLKIFVSSLFSMGKKNWYVLHSAHSRADMPTSILKRGSIPHFRSSFGSLGIGERCFESQNNSVNSNPFADGFLISREISKVSFELLKGFSVTPEKWQQGMFWVTQNLSGYSENLAAGLPLRSREADVLLIHYIYTNVLFPQWLEHFGDATLLLFHVWMDIKVKRGLDIGVS